jgi:hypothetical protein
MMYEVPVREVRSYRVHVEADSAEEAMDKADVLIVQERVTDPRAVIWDVIDAWPVRADHPSRSNRDQVTPDA